MKNRIDELEKFNGGGDLASLEQWIVDHHPLSPEEVTTAIHCYKSIYEIWFSDLVCDKFSGNLPGIVDELLGMLDQIQALDPQQDSLMERANCFMQLAKYKKSTKEKVECYDQALAFIEKLIQKEADNTSHFATLARVQMARNKLTQSFSDQDIDQILSYFEKSLSRDPIASLSPLIHTAYEMFSLPMENSLKNYRKFAELADKKAIESSTGHKWGLYEWAERHDRCLDLFDGKIPPEIVQQSLSLVEKAMTAFENYQTNDDMQLNKLGRLFRNLDKRQPTAPDEIRLKRLNTALGFYLAAQKLQYLAWTYPVYATGILIEQIDIHLKNKDVEKAKAAYESGLQIFEFSRGAMDNYGFVQRWGEFLYFFNRDVFSFQNPQLISAAEEKFNLAKQIGNGFYSSCFVYLAKLALLRQDEGRALQEVRDFRLALKEKYNHLQDIGEFLNDPDLAPLIPEIQKRLSTWQ